MKKKNSELNEAEKKLNALNADVKTWDKFMETANAVFRTTYGFLKEQCEDDVTSQKVKEWLNSREGYYYLQMFFVAGALYEANHCEMKGYSEDIIASIRFAQTTN